MPDFGIFRGFNEKLFGDKLVAGQLPTQLGFIGSEDFRPLLLDFYPNAAVAYSLRKLRVGYTGDAIEVRRSSDNTTQDIGFVNNELDTTSLASFCSGTDGFVTTWYDQSGNGYDATQTTAANQPQIVNSGSVITINGKPAIYSNDKILRNTTIPISNQPISDFFIFKVNSFLSNPNGFNAYYDGATLTNERGFFGYQASIIKDVQFNGVILEGYSSSSNQILTTNIRNTNSSEIYKNNSLEATGNSGNNSIGGVTFGRDYALETPSDIYYQEFIRYISLSTNISGINTNINDFYSIY